MVRVLALIVALMCAAPAIAQPLPAGLDKQNAIVIDTTKGRIVFKLRTDLAPKHAERIKQLAREGYYNNVPFHRVMDGFMAQTGDGKNFDGTGGSKYPNLKQEFSSVPFTRGIVGMARRGDSVDTANSQFFFMFGDAPSLNGQYTVIGEVVSGMDVVDKLKKAPPGSSGGSVTDPDKMVKVQVASDIKWRWRGLTISASWLQQGCCCCRRAARWPNRNRSIPSAICLRS
jgi:peptidylprolyl isomerase